MEVKKPLAFVIKHHAKGFLKYPVMLSTQLAELISWKFYRSSTLSPLGASPNA